MKCNSYDTINELKLKILALSESIPPIEQVLYFGGKSFENNWILADYNIQEFSTVLFVFHINGMLIW